MVRVVAKMGWLIHHYELWKSKIITSESSGDYYKANSAMPAADRSYINVYGIVTCEWKSEQVGARACNLAGD